MSESMPRRRSRVSGDEASAARRQSKGDVGGIVTTQYAAKQSIRKLRKQTSGTSYKSISSIGSEGGDGGTAIEPLPPLEDIDDEVFEEVKKERTKSTESDMRSASGGKHNLLPFYTEDRCAFQEWPQMHPLSPMQWWSTI